MAWATQYIERLRAGKAARFRPYGNSMSGRVESGALVTVEPLAEQSLAVGDVVLCVVNNQQYLHLITAIQGSSYQIGNNHGKINGWIPRSDIFGVLVRIEP